MIIDCDTYLMPREAFDGVDEELCSDQELIRWRNAERLFYSAL